MGIAVGRKIDGSGHVILPVANDGLSIPVSGASFDLDDWSHVLTTTLASSLVVKAAAGTLGFASGRLDQSAATGNYYIQMWNLAALPADATAVSTVNSLANPFKIAHVNGLDDYWQMSTPAGGEEATAGIVIGVSTTEFTKTAAGNIISATATFQ